MDNHYIQLTGQSLMVPDAQQQALNAYNDARHLSIVNAEANIRQQAQLNAFAFKEQVKTQTFLERAALQQQIKNAAEEKRRSIYESVAIAEDGSIIAQTQNLNMPVQPRYVSNMKSPSLSRLIRLENETDLVYLLTTGVAGSAVSVFLNAERMSSGTYVLNKLSTQGIIFFAETSAKRKSYAQQIIAILISACISSQLIPDTYGWAQLPDGNFKFYGKEALLWPDLMKLSK